MAPPSPSAALKPAPRREEEPDAELDVPSAAPDGTEAGLEPASQFIEQLPAAISVRSVLDSQAGCSQAAEAAPTGTTRQGHPEVPSAAVGTHSSGQHPGRHEATVCCSSLRQQPAQQGATSAAAEERSVRFAAPVESIAPAAGQAGERPASQPQGAEVPAAASEQAEGKAEEVAAEKAAAPQHSQPELATALAQALLAVEKRGGYALLDLMPKVFKVRSSTARWRLHRFTSLESSDLDSSLTTDTTTIILKGPAAGSADPPAGKDCQGSTTTCGSLCSPPKAAPAPPIRIVLRVTQQHLRDAPLVSTQVAQTLEAAESAALQRAHVAFTGEQRGFASQLHTALHDINAQGGAELRRLVERMLAAGVSLETAAAAFFDAAVGQAPPGSMNSVIGLTRLDHPAPVPADSD